MGVFAALAAGGLLLAPAAGTLSGTLTLPTAASFVWGALLAPAAVASTSSRPPRVAKDATDFGGGDAQAQKHLRPMQEQGTASPAAELTDTPSWADFYSGFVRPNRPVVLRGHTKTFQRAHSLWTDQYLAKHWGTRKINVELNKTEERGGPSGQLLFRNFLMEMYKEERRDELYAIVDFDEDVKAKADFTLPPPINCKEIVPQSLTLWISSGGTSSVLHQDDAENFLMQLDGTKSVMLVHQDRAQDLYTHIAETRGTSPVHQRQVDLEAFPRFGNVSWFHAELRPGDTLYIPHTYWHQVTSEGRNLAANLWWGHRGEWQWWDPSDPGYDATRFGGPGGKSFDTLKGSGPETLPCTLLSAKSDLSKVRFQNEGAWKDYLIRTRRKKQQQSDL